MSRTRTQPSTTAEDRLNRIRETSHKTRTTLREGAAFVAALPIVERSNFLYDMARSYLTPEELGQLIARLIETDGPLSTGPSTEGPKEDVLQSIVEPTEARPQPVLRLVYNHTQNIRDLLASRTSGFTCREICSILGRKLTDVSPVLCRLRDEGELTLNGKVWRSVTPQGSAESVIEEEVEEIPSPSTETSPEPSEDEPTAQEGEPTLRPISFILIDFMKSQTKGYTIATLIRHVQKVRPCDPRSVWHALYRMRVVEGIVFYNKKSKLYKIKAL